MVKNPELRRIAWVEPDQVPFGEKIPTVYSDAAMPRGGPLMAAWMQRYGTDVTVFSGEVTELDPDRLAGYDLVCVSVLSNSAPHGLVLARQLRQRGVTVVMGGYHFAHTATTPETLAPTVEALNFCDYVVRGEGFVALPTLLGVLRGQQSLENVPGLSWVDHAGEVRHNPVGSGLGREQALKVPASDWSDETLVDGTSFHIINEHGIFGCARKCSFCAVWTRDGNGSRAVDPVLFVQGLRRTLADRPHLKHLFFSSDNLPIVHTWATAVCEEMIRQPLRVSWTCQGEVRTAVQRPDLMKLMAQAGCVRVCMGLESINPEALAGSNKGQTRQMMEEAIKVVHRNGLAVHGMFIVGLPGDTRQSVRDTVAWAKQMKIETVQFLCLCGLPGSPDYENYRLWERAFRPFTGELAPLNWFFVNGHYAQISNEMSLDDIQEAATEAMLDFYSPGRVVAPALCLGRGWVGRLITTGLRWRGWKNTRKWLQHPLNQAYCQLLKVEPGSQEWVRLHEKLIRCLPAGWLETLVETPRLYEAVA